MCVFHFNIHCNYMNMRPENSVNHSQTEWINIKGCLLLTQAMNMCPWMLVSAHTLIRRITILHAGCQAVIMTEGASSNLSARPVTLKEQRQFECHTHTKSEWGGQRFSANVKERLDFGEQSAIHGAGDGVTPIPVWVINGERGDRMKRDTHKKHE